MPYPLEEKLRHANDGSIKFYDAAILGQLIQDYAPRRILEIGSFIGFSTRWLLETSRPCRAQVVAVDPDVRHRIFNQPGALLRKLNASYLGSRLEVKRGFFSENVSGNYYYDYEHYAPQVSRPEVDGIMRARRVLHSGNLGAGKFDFIFIDGGHSERAVHSNFAEALKLLRPQGCIAFHDAISWPDVGRALTAIGRQYAGAARVRVYGTGIRQYSHAALCDGIGVFQLH